LIWVITTREEKSTAKAQKAQKEGKNKRKMIIFFPLCAVAVKFPGFYVYGS
jgi:hypothetical protein